MKTTKLNRVQRTRLKSMCVALGFNPIELGIDKPMSSSDTPANWLEICVRLFELIVGYNNSKLGDMMYFFMLGTENPVDFLHKKFKEDGIVVQSNIYKAQQKKK